MKRHLSRITIWGAVLMIAALATQPLLGLPPRGHDAFLHYYRIPVVSELWHHGILFSRWVPDLVYGYGSPLFNFYPPLSAYLLAALYWLAGQNGPLAYSLSYAVGLFIATVSMFLLGRHLFGSSGGLLATAAYVWSPQVLLQTYSRGSLSNALALAFAPLAALALLRVSQQATGRRIALAAVSVALVQLSHTAAGLLLIAALLLLGLGAARWLYCTRPAPVLAALLLGMALASFTWLPGLAEIGFTRYAAEVENGGAEFADHFAAGLAWPEQTIAGLAKTPLPHSAGVGQLLLGSAGAVLAAGRWRRKRGGSSARLVVLAGVAGLSVFFLATPASAWLWEHSERLRQVQFPWRLLDAPVFLLALTVAWWANAIRPRWRPWLLGAVLVLLFANAVPYQYPARLAALPQRPTLADTSNAQQVYGILGLTAWGEYSSEAVEQWPSGAAFAGADQGAPLFEKLAVPQGVELHAAGGGLLAATWQLFATEATPVTLSVHDFAGWQAEIDGSNVPIETDEQGRIQIAVPAGLHELAVSWRRTPVRWLADGLSLLALAAMAWVSVRPGRRRPATNPSAAPQEATAAPWWPLALLAGLLVLKVAILDRTNTLLVVHPDTEHIPSVARPAEGDFGVFRLLGYEMAEPDLLALYWYAPRQVTERYTVRVTMADALGVPVQEIDNVYPGDNPTTSWEAGMLVRDVYRLPLDEQPAPAAYSLSVAVLNPDTGEPVPIRDGPPGATTVGAGTLKRAPQPVAIPPGAQALDALFGGAIVLTHGELPESVARGAPLSLTLFWESRAPVDHNYTVFVHVLRPDGEFVAAYDGPPLDGRYPTGFWEPGEVIADIRELDLEVAPGDYELQVGLYELESGIRLPLSGSPTPFDDRVTVGSFSVR